MPPMGPQEPPQDERIYNRRQPDGTFRPLGGYFFGARTTFDGARGPVPRYVVLAVSAWWAIWDRWTERQAVGGRLWASREEAQAYADEMMETASLEEGQRC